MHPEIPLAFLASRAHSWLMANLLPTRTPKALLHRALLQQVMSQPVLILVVIPSQVQDSILAFVKPYLISCCPSLQPVQVLLNGSTTFWCVGHSLQFCIVSVLAEDRHYQFLFLVSCSCVLVLRQIKKKKNILILFLLSFSFLV